jgi:enoyl-CoA hydratase/carnithine racemase
MFEKQLKMDLPEAYRFAGDTMAANMMEPDTVEGIDAFIAKRDPRWKR